MDIVGQGISQLTKLVTQKECQSTSYAWMVSVEMVVVNRDQTIDNGLEEV